MSNNQNELVAELWKDYLNASNCTQGIVMCGLLIFTGLILLFLRDTIPKMIGSSIGILCKHFLSIMGAELRMGIKNASGIERTDFIVFILAIIGTVIVSAIVALAGVRGLCLSLIVVSGIIMILIVAILSVLLVYHERDKMKRLEALKVLIA